MPMKTEVCLNIMIVCATGASSSCLALNINKVAKQLGRSNVRAKARSEYEFEGYLEETDVLLIGPHLKNMEESLKNAAAEFDVPAGCISAEAYGKLNGDLALKEAMALIKKGESK